MKKLLAIALIASLTIGSALAKEPAKPAPKAWYKRPIIKPVKPITDPKELNKQIRDITAKVGKTIRKRARYFADRNRAANKGDQKLVQELTDKIRRKDAKIAKHRALLRMYTLRLVMLKAREIKKEKKVEKKEKKKKRVKRVKKDKKKEAKPATKTNKSNY